MDELNEEPLISPESLSEVCRLCLVSKRSLTNMKDNIEMFTIYKNLFEIKEDTICFMSCKQCLRKLKESNAFIEMCRKSEERIQASVIKLKSISEGIKVEQVEQEDYEMFEPIVEHLEKGMFIVKANTETDTFKDDENYDFQLNITSERESLVQENPLAESDSAMSSSEINDKEDVKSSSEMYDQEDVMSDKEDIKTSGDVVDKEDAKSLGEINKKEEVDNIEEAEVKPKGLCEKCGETKAPKKRHICQNKLRNQETGTFEYRDEMIRKLLLAQNIKQKSKGVPCIDHFPNKEDKRKRCRLCGQQKQRRMTWYSCIQCKDNHGNPIGLCPAPCFGKWHKCHK